MAASRTLGATLIVAISFAACADDGAPEGSTDPSITGATSGAGGTTVTGAAGVGRSALKRLRQPRLAMPVAVRMRAAQSLARAALSAREMSRPPWSTTA